MVKQKKYVGCRRLFFLGFYKTHNTPEEAYNKLFWQKDKRQHLYKKKEKLQLKIGFVSFNSPIFIFIYFYIYKKQQNRILLL